MGFKCTFLRLCVNTKNIFRTSKDSWMQVKSIQFLIAIRLLTYVSKHFKITGGRDLVVDRLTWLYIHNVSYMWPEQFLPIIVHVYREPYPLANRYKST